MYIFVRQPRAQHTPAQHVWQMMFTAGHPAQHSRSPYSSSEVVASRTIYLNWCTQKVIVFRWPDLCVKKTYTELCIVFSICVCDVTRVCLCASTYMVISLYAMRFYAGWMSWTWPEFVHQKIRLTFFAQPTTSEPLHSSIESGNLPGSACFAAQIKYCAYSLCSRIQIYKYIC